MGFKSDREFLRNISIGAIGTQKVVTLLKLTGFNVIELERTSLSNKVWATKLKRLRLPDLLCLKSGIRIESRAKSKLQLTMSHAQNDILRAWDYAARDTDLVAFIRCTQENDGTWCASDRLTLFRIGDLRASQARAKLSKMKSASEGAEVHLTWPFSVPQSAGTVTEVTATAVKTRLATGRRQTYQLTKGKGAAKYQLQPYVAAGDTFGAGDTVIASVIPAIAPNQCPQCKQYDFLVDLESDNDSCVYAAVKALGYLPSFRSKSMGRLASILESGTDARIRLEAAASLARLGVPEAWKALIAAAEGIEPDFAMEATFILSEIGGDNAVAALHRIANTSARPSELRSAAVWGLARLARSAELVPLVSTSDEMTAVHAISGLSRVIQEVEVPGLLQTLGKDQRLSAGIVRTLLESKLEIVSTAVPMTAEAKGNQRNWLLYLLGCLGRQRCEATIKAFCPALISELEFYWSYQNENWLNRLDVADQIDFLSSQTLR